MKITICGSIFFYDKMCKIKKELEGLGHKVEVPPCELRDDKGKIISVQKYYKVRKLETDDESWVWERKRWAMKTYFDKVVAADVVLVANYAKNNIDGYVGANTLIEMGLALHLDKKIYMLNDVPNISYKEEILGMNPIVIKDNLSLIR